MKVRLQVVASRCLQVISEDGTALGVLDDSYTLSIEVWHTSPCLRSMHAAPAADHMPQRWQHKCLKRTPTYNQRTVAVVPTQVSNRAGSLMDITAAIARQDINVQSLAVGSSEQPGRSRITVVIPRDEEGLPGLVQQVEHALRPWIYSHYSCDTATACGLLKLQTTAPSRRAPSSGRSAM